MGSAAAIGVLGALALVPASAGATVSIGSNLAFEPNASRTCGAMNQCTFVASAMTTETVAGGYPSPVNGTVVRWRIRTGSGPGDSAPVALRVVRRNGGLYVGAGTSGTITPETGKVTETPVSLPIAIGDLLGINCCDNSDNGNFFLALGGQSTQQFNLRLPDGGAGLAPNAQFGEQVLINADIEPTNTFAVGSVVTAKGGAVTLAVDVPNPGTLRGGDPADPTVRAHTSKKGKKKKKKKPLLNGTSAAINAPGPVVLTLTPTAAARKLMHPKAKKGKKKPKGRRIHASVKLVFTPSGGTASAQTIGVTLRP